jgi:hypothetical protein
LTKLPVVVDVLAVVPGILKTPEFVSDARSVRVAVAAATPDGAEYH